MSPTFAYGEEAPLESDRPLPDLEGFAMSLPTAYYWDKSMRIIRNDVLDRFGTPLERRFRREQIESVMKSCGLEDLRFSDNAPYWRAVGRRRG